jgi:hypothetical protein
VAAQPGHQGRWSSLTPPTRLISWCLLCLAALAVAACGTSAPPPPATSGGVYTSEAYHFNLTYPSGWQVNTASGTTPSTTIPLQIVVTRINAQPSGGGQVSTLTVVVFNAQESTVASQIKSLLQLVRKSGSGYVPVTISGVKGYRHAQQPAVIYGTTITDTHTDYYLITAKFEYQISTDSVSSDNDQGALETMVQSFTLLK